MRDSSMRMFENVSCGKKCLSAFPFWPLYSQATKFFVAFPPFPTSEVHNNSRLSFIKLLIKNTVSAIGLHYMYIGLQIIR